MKEKINKTKKVVVKKNKPVKTKTTTTPKKTEKVSEITKPDTKNIPFVVCLSKKRNKQRISIEICQRACKDKKECLAYKEVIKNNPNTVKSFEEKEEVVKTSGGKRLPSIHKEREKKVKPKVDKYTRAYAFTEILKNYKENEGFTVIEITKESNKLFIEKEGKDSFNGARNYAVFALPVLQLLNIVKKEGKKYYYNGEK